LHAASTEPSTAIPKDQENPPVLGVFSKLHAASTETSTAIPKDQENPPVLGVFANLHAAVGQGQGQGKGKEVAPMQPSTRFNRVNTTSLASSSLPPRADGTRPVNPAPPTKAQLKELQELQGRESAASAAAIAKKILERNPVDQEAKRKREEFMRKTITEPVPGTRKITFPGNKVSQMYFLAYPRGGHSSVNLTATVSLLSLNAYNRIPAQYQPEMLQYTTRPHVWVHYHDDSDEQLIFEHPMGPTGVVDIGPYFKYEQLRQHVSYKQNSEGRYDSPEATSPRKRLSSNVKDVAHTILDFVKCAQERRGWVTPKLWFWKQVTVNTGLGAAIPAHEYERLFKDAESSERLRAIVGFRPLAKGACEFTTPLTRMTDEEAPTFANHQRFFMISSVDGDPTCQIVASVYDVMDFFKEVEDLHRDTEQQFPVVTVRGLKRRRPQASSCYGDPSHLAKKRRLAGGSEN
ncbi:hypothetical protein HDU80_002644, partial [Chytriomyces hyalinus]